MNETNKILLVDDTKELNDASARILKSEGYEVSQAFNGKECLQMLESFIPDLLLLDVVMPGIDGIEVCKQIKSNPKTAEIFIILLSSQRITSDYQSEGLEEGADDYIIRPFQKREFLARIGSAFRIINSEKRLKIALSKSQELELEHSKFSEIIQNNLNEIYIFDSISFKFEYANHGALQNTGYQLDELKIMTIFDLLPDISESEFKLKTQALINGVVKQLVFETSYQRKNRSIYSVEVHLQLYKQNEKTVVFTLIKDITDRKTIEKALQDSENYLKELNSTKDKFFSIIAHDLKSPFNGFLGLTQILAEELPTMTLNQIQKVSVSMRNSALNLYSLLENLLEWAKIQRGLIPFEPIELNLLQVIKDSIETIKENADKKNIEIKIQIADNYQLIADKNMLQSIIRNLVSNAIKYTNIGGEVEIKANTLPDNSLQISVHDTGIGMNSEIMENIFSINTETGRKGTGGESSTGLGLILCKEFVEKHNGKIWAESEEGKGSTFYFTIITNK